MKGCGRQSLLVQSDVAHCRRDFEVDHDGPEASQKKGRLRKYVET